MVFAVFFGFVHQAGVVQSVAYVDANVDLGNSTATSLFISRTFLVPKFLTARMHQKVKTVDYRGNHPGLFQELVDSCIARKQEKYALCISRYLK